jgi:hypothetical protein
MATLLVEWFLLRAPASYLRLMRDVTLGLYNYFSIPFLFMSLFAPWRHDTVSLQNVSANLWGQVIIGNIVSRTIGFIVRLTTIMAGLIALLVWNIGSIFFLLSWYGLPIVMISSIIYGVRLLEM